jgi:Tfp pilus assembly protein PilF
LRRFALSSVAAAALGAGLALMAGCAGAPLIAYDEVLADDLFAAQREKVRAEDVLAVDDAMRAFVVEGVAPRARRLGPARGLSETMRDALALDYDTEITRNAREAFAARAGNCLSLVILTGALAHELGVPVRYMSVRGQDTWSRSAGFAFRSGHVAVVLGDTRIDRGTGPAVVLDYTPAAIVPPARDREIDEATVVAMYLSNRAAELLDGGQIGRAYWWARAAIAQAPGYASAYNTLAVVYLRSGEALRAENALRVVLEREPENELALSNLALALARQGRADEAAAVRAQLLALQPYPPFHFMDAGLAALRQGETRTALELFERELRRMPYDDQVHFAMAMAELQLGRARRARAHIELALENSRTADHRGIYAAKLARLDRQMRQDAGTRK